MKNILQTIAEYARTRVAADKERLSEEALTEMCADLLRSEVMRKSIDLPAKKDKAEFNKERGAGRFEAALNAPGMSFICEVKKASPSKGLISPDFPYIEIAKEYEAAGANAISCLTEPKWFLGSDEIFKEIRAEVKTPMLRKDFTVDSYQIYQAKLMGADAVLLICALLDAGTLEKYLGICEEIGLAALVETHTSKEAEMAAKTGAKIIGVNNRNLKDFSVDFSNAARLRDLIPPDAIYVAESGVKGPGDVAALKKIGADAVLVGEVLMRNLNKTELLHLMRDATFE